VGLLLTPVAASAAAAVCLGGGEVTTAMNGSPVADHSQHKADHSCCDPQGGPAKHDSQACAKACAAMSATAAAVLDDGGAVTLVALGGPAMDATPPKAFHAHAPPGLKRPPRTLA
jgi:hypothetical protein